MRTLNYFQFFIDEAFSSAEGFLLTTPCIYFADLSLKFIKVCLVMLDVEYFLFVPLSSNILYMVKAAPMHYFV